jgi:hypothetical protein
VITISLNMLVVSLATLIPVVSASVHMARRSAIDRRTASTLLCLHVAGQSLVLMFIVVVVGHLKLGTLVPLRVATAVVLVGLVGLIGVALATRAIARSTVARSLRLVTQQWAVALAVAAVALLPSLVLIRSAGNRFGLATLFNGDIANYSLVADNVALAGFGDSGHVLNANYGNFAATSSNGGTAIINHLSAITSLRSWQVLMAAMGYALILAFLCLKELARRAWPSVDRGHAVAASIAILCPLSSVLAGQYFLNNIIGIGACALALAGLVTLARAPSPDATALVSIFLGLSVLIYSYATFGLPLVVASLVIVPVIYAGVAEHRLEPVRLLRWRLVRLCAVLVGTLAVCAPALKMGIDTLRLQANAQVGYPLDHLGAFGALLWPSWIVPEFRGIDMPSSWQVGSWLVLVAAVAFLLHRSCARSDRRLAALAVLAISVAAVGASIAWGNGFYQTWKLWAFLVPIGLVLLVPALWTLREGRDSAVGVAVAWVLVGASLTAPMGTWTSVIWSPSLNETSQASLLASTRSIDSWGIDVVNVNLAPYLETMTAGTLLEHTRVAFNSGSYIDGPMVLSNTCTLTTRSLVSDPTQVIALSGEYVLVPVPAPCAMKSGTSDLTVE